MWSDYTDDEQDAVVAFLAEMTRRAASTDSKSALRSMVEAGAYYALSRRERTFLRDAMTTPLSTLISGDDALDAARVRIREDLPTLSSAAQEQAALEGVGERIVDPAVWAAWLAEFGVADDEP